MTPLQVLVLVLFAAVTYANTFLQQPGVELAPELRAALVALNVTMFFTALNLEKFSELGRPKTSLGDIIAPLAPEGASIELTSTSLPTATPAADPPPPA